MDPKELEDKLEKDNLTLKEHILKLQNTIKNIKTELSNTNNNTTYINTLSQIDISTIKNSKIESPKYNGKLNNKDDSDEEINNLKFSFKNIKAEQKLLEENKRKRENDLIKNNNKKAEETNLHLKSKNKYDDTESYASNNNSYKKDFEEKMKDKKNNINSHIYKDNFAKIKNEKEIIEKMENVRNTANLKKKYTGTDSNEDTEYEKFHRINNLTKNNNVNNNNNKKLEEGENNCKQYDNNYNNSKNDYTKGYMKGNSYEDSDNEGKDLYENKGNQKQEDFDVKHNRIPKYPNSNEFDFNLHILIN